MTDVSVPPDEAAPAPSEPDTGTDLSRVDLGWAVAGLSAAAGAIHLAMVPSHAGGDLIDPIGFAVVGWFQLLCAGAILTGRAGRNVYRAVVIGNLVVLGLWIWSRTTGLPVGSHSGVAEDVTIVDGMTALLEVGAILLAARILMAPAGTRVAAGKIGPVLAGVAALGLATVVIVSPEANEHGGAGHSHGEEMADGHAHDDGTAHADQMAQIDAERCDRQLNPPAYWDEAAYLGIDTYQGGAMASHDDGHGSTATPSTTEPDPLEGRGSPELDELITVTDAADGGEVAAAALVTALGEADDETYDAWLWRMRSTGALGGGGHAHDPSAPDESGHGGHNGPQPWIAMTDPAECEQLADELAQARDIALSYPTAADATEAGWMRVTGYVPGIAAHYMRFGYVDGEFHVDEPEMLLYDGSGPDAHIVGLSYYIVHEGDAEPSQGFTGPNDHFHRHQGLCVGPGGVIGDSTTTEEECAERGGRKDNGGLGWMNHVWIVPGCESPWGMFSGATPVLDRQTSEQSGQNDGACAGSAVRDRYGLDDLPASGGAPASGAQPARAGG